LASHIQILFRNQEGYNLHLHPSIGYLEKGLKKKHSARMSLSKEVD
jgi:hypothetical protein